MALGERADIRAAMREPDGPGAVAFDFTRTPTFEAALDGVTAVFLMRPPQMAKAEMFEPFLDAAVAAGVSRFVVLSVAGADRIKMLPHHGLEQAVMARTDDWTMLRPSDFMQNLETEHARTIREDNAVAVPAGEGRSAFVDVADVGAAAAACLLEEGHAGAGYHLTGPDALSFHDVAETLSDVLGRYIRYRPLSVARFIAERLKADEPLPKVLVMSALYTAQRLGKTDTVTREVERLLGRKAGTLRDYAEREKAVWL